MKPTPINLPPVKTRRWLRRLGWAAVAWVLAVGPWPADNGDFQQAGYWERTRQALEQTALMAAEPGPLRAGWAEADLTPGPGHPLAGYGGRSPMGYESVDTRCFARALTIERGDAAVTILTADLLLINRAMARRVLELSGLDAAPERLYFTATHNHSGPGAWGESMLERLVVGPYDPDYFEELCRRMADAVQRSRRSLRPAELAMVSVGAGDRLTNRVEEGLPCDEALWAIAVRERGAERRMLAVLAGFSAHATVLGSKSRWLSADYPGAMCDRLRERTGAEMALFAAASVGDARPKLDGGRGGREAARRYGGELADRLADAMKSAEYRGEARLGALRWMIETDDPRVQIGASWRVSPLSTFWMSDASAPIHVLRIGGAWLAGMPGDYAGHLTVKLRSRVAEPLWVTSFNGDYKGYFTDRATFYRVGGYETRQMNFFGASAGEYLGEAALAAIERLRSAGASP
jgi:hypothetical protein